MQTRNGYSQGFTSSRPGPIASLLAAIIMVVLLVTLFVVLLPLALILLGALVLFVVVVKAKVALDKMGAEKRAKHVPRRDREGRKNVRVINR